MAEPEDLTPFELLSAAHNAALGIVVETEDADRLRQRLYAERKKDPDFANISILTSRTSPATELLLIKGAPSNDEEH